MTTRDRVHEPHPARLPAAHPQRAAILDAHEAALTADQPGYLDPVTGFFVFTSVELADRGPCCDSGCRHCPYA